MFYSQQNEDEILYKKYLNYENGFFIELGAMNGVQFSNTLFFENELKWSGILIEPTNQYDEMIKNRPNCINYNVAVSSIKDETEFLGNYALGGIVKTMSEGHKVSWELEKNWEPILVKTKLMSELIPDNIKEIDFFSIDVEGGEYEVLLTHNWDINTYVILIEMEMGNKNNKKCRNLLSEKGFTFDMVIGNNEIWINNGFKKN